MLEAGLRQGRDELNGEREKAGLAPTERFHGGTSEGLGDGGDAIRSSSIRGAGRSMCM